MRLLPLPAAAVALLLLAQCKKADLDPVDQLPPATQTGANQVGCLVNGQPWVPVGGGTSKNFFVDYDPTLGQGVCALNVTRYVANYPKDESLTVFANPFKNAGIYDLGNSQLTATSFDSPLMKCYYSSREAGTYCRGTLTITRLDPQARIIAGTFAFILARPGCDTLKVTQGRFDKKL